jgi:hypothetical protein
MTDTPRPSAAEPPKPCLPLFILALLLLPGQWSDSVSPTARDAAAPSSHSGATSMVPMPDPVLTNDPLELTQLLSSLIPTFLLIPSLNRHRATFEQGKHYQLWRQQPFLITPRHTSPGKSTANLSVVSSCVPANTEKELTCGLLQ